MNAPPPSDFNSASTSNSASKSVVNPEGLFLYTIGKLKENMATRTIPQRLEDPQYDRVFGERILLLIFNLCRNEFSEYDRQLKNFIVFSAEFLRLQVELERTGKYHFASYADAKQAIYENPEVMENRYLYGLLFSQALWINHHKIFQFFLQNFCVPASSLPERKVLEVPVGTGIFLAEFLRSCPAWKGEGYDISPSAISFSQKTMALLFPNAHLEKKDVFAISEDKKYDRIICGLLLENLEDPRSLLKKLGSLLAPQGKIFLTSNAWASTLDHIYLFISVREIKSLLEEFFFIEKELSIALFPGKSAEEEKTPVNYACILQPKV